MDQIYKCHKENAGLPNLNTEDEAPNAEGDVSGCAIVGAGTILAEKIILRHVSPICLLYVNAFIELGHTSELLTFLFVSEKFQALDKRSKKQTKNRFISQ